MNAARTSAPLAAPRYALVVSANEGHIRVDRQFLKNARIPLSKAVASGAEAFRILAKHPVDIVLVDDQLADCSGWDFLRQLRANPSLKNQAVIMLSAEGRKENLLQAIELGCLGFLLRPYSMDTFCRHLALARQARNFFSREARAVEKAVDMAAAGRVEEAMPVLNQAATEAGDAAQYYEQGLRALAKAQYDSAIECFSAAARLSAVMAEAHLGLARCWLAKGDPVRFRKAMTQAAAVCAEAQRFEHYKQEFLAILQADSSEFNPFLSLGLQLAGGRDWDGAAMAMKNALWLTPNDPKVHLELAKVHHFRRQPELAKQSVSQALALGGSDPEAHALFERWTGTRYGEHERGEETKETARQGFPEIIPGMLNAVLYLAGVVTEGLHRFRRPYA